MFGYAEDNIPDDLNFLEKHAPVKATVKANAKGSIDAPEIIKDDSGNEAIDTVDELSMYVMMPVSAFFLVCVMVGNVIGLKGPTKAIPVSASTTMVAVLLGFLVRYAISQNMLEARDFSFMGSTLLNCFFLPIIIFNSGWALPVPSFLSQLEYILIFAILGTIISTLIVGFGGYYLGNMGWHPVTSMRANLAFGALISACDPVATLATFTHLNMETRQPLLNVVLLGESMLNDAVAIVLFTVINTDYGQVQNMSALIPSVFKQLFGAIFFGIAIAMVLVFMMRMANLPGHTTEETMFVFASSFFCFAAGTSMGLSGIIVNLFAGIIFGRYARMHLSDHGDEVCTEYLQISGEFCDTCVFMLCGTVTALIPDFEGVVYGVVMVLLCLIARGVGMPVCGVICNCIKKCRKDPLTFGNKLIYMMWHGGLRGGIALVLAIELDGDWCKQKGIVLSGTFFVMASLLLVMGSTTEIVLGALGMSGIDEGDDAPVADSSVFTHMPDDLIVVEYDYERWPFKVAAKLNQMFIFLLVGEDIPRNWAKNKKKGNKDASEPLLTIQE